MFGEEEDDWGDDVGEGDAMLLDGGTELFDFESGHDDEVKATVHTLVNEASEPWEILAGLAETLGGVSRTIDVEEGKERKYVVSLAVWATIPCNVARLACFDLEDVGYDVLMAKHDTFRMAGCSGRVHQECEVFLRVDP